MRTMFKGLWSALRETFWAWNNHEGSRLGAALAFYTILSLAPFVVFVIAIVALVVGHSNAQAQITDQVQALIGAVGANAIRTVIEQAQKPTSGTFASIIGVVTLLFGASSVASELRSALNKIWDVQPDVRSGLAGLLKDRFFSFGIVLAIGFLLLVSLMLSAALAALAAYFTELLPMPVFLLTAADFTISFVGISVLFALIFKYVPATDIAWKHVGTGAVVTAFLFTVGKSLIGLYLGTASIGSAYGAAGSLIVVTVWVYYSAMIFYFGAEFTHVHARLDGTAMPARAEAGLKQNY
jgi:membrane protein